MDIIAFLTRRGQISLQAMLCAFSYLSDAQSMKGFIEYDEIHQGLLLGADLSGAEVDVHSSIIYGKSMLFHTLELIYSFRYDNFFLTHIFKILSLIRGHSSAGYIR